MKVINDTVTFFSKKLQTPKFFLNLEKKRGNQNQIRKLIIDEKEIDGDVEILKKIESFYETLLKSLAVSQQRSNKSLRKRLI